MIILLFLLYFVIIYVQNANACRRRKLSITKITMSWKLVFHLLHCFYFSVILFSFLETTAFIVKSHSKLLQQVSHSILSFLSLINFLYDFSSPDWKAQLKIPPRDTRFKTEVKLISKMLGLIANCWFLMFVLMNGRINFYCRIIDNEEGTFTHLSNMWQS